MLGMRFGHFVLAGALLSASVPAALAAGSPQEHGRKYKPLPDTAHVAITVLKGFNDKPFPNAGVVFHAIREGKDDGNLEVKTDPDGHAVIDVLEVGSHVLVQVIAKGFATYATDFDLTSEGKELTVKLQRPRAQVSTYAENEGKPAQVRPGTQERVIPKPNSATNPATNPGSTR